MGGTIQTPLLHVVDEASPWLGFGESINNTVMSQTVARPIPSTGAHFYDPQTGEPRHFVPKKDGSGDRPSTIRDCRENGWVPSVTQILKLLHKEALVQWQIEQGILAAITTPRLPNETDDAFVYRIVHTEKVHEEEARIAREKGTQLHAAVECYFVGKPVPPEDEPWVRPAIDALIAFGELASSEVTLIGEGFGGRTDLIQNCEGCWRIWDLKTARKLPDPVKGGAYFEHRLQLAAYAKAWALKLAKGGGEQKPIMLGNCYISTSNQGEFVICEHEEEWSETYANGFWPLLHHWAWVNRYTPPGFANPSVPHPVNVEVENMRAHYVKLTEEAEKNQAALKAKLEAENVTISTLRGQLMQLQTELTVAQKQAVAGKQALASGTAPTTPRPAVVPTALPGQPAPRPAPQPAAIPPSPQHSTTTPPRPHNAPPGKKIVWTEGTPTPQPPPGPMPLQ